MRWAGNWFIFGPSRAKNVLVSSNGSKMKGVGKTEKTPNGNNANSNSSVSSFRR
jgi:hypothetical protein